MVMKPIINTLRDFDYLNERMAKLERKVNDNKCGELSYMAFITIDVVIGCLGI